MQKVPQLIAAFAKIVKRGGDRGEGMVVPFVDSPRSVLNGRVREKRRFATQQFSIERLRTVARAGGGTLSDVVLGICSGALRRFLQERDSLPEKSLTAGIPVSVRPKDDEGTGNAINFIIATLGTDIADAAERLEAIRASVKHAKEHVQSLPKHAMSQYTMLLMAPTLVTMLTGIGGRMRPMSNVTISNVPGPDKPLYFRGAEMVATYPASIVTHGLALNITCQSYAGWMNFGFTGCHSSVPEPAAPRGIHGRRAGGARSRDRPSAGRPRRRRVCVPRQELRSPRQRRPRLRKQRQHAPPLRHDHASGRPHSRLCVTHRRHSTVTASASLWSTVIPGVASGARERPDLTDWGTW